jgi:hypothetical protein
MIRLVVGGKGKGKTKILLDQANEAIKISNGNIVFIDKSSKHMYELNNKVRLIDMSNLPLKNSDQFLGALSGILSQDHDIEKVYLDNFMKLAKIEEDELNKCLEECESISDLFNVEFIIGVSVDKEVLNDSLQSKISVEC